MPIGVLIIFGAMALFAAIVARIAGRRFWVSLLLALPLIALGSGVPLALGWLNQLPAGIFGEVVGIVILLLVTRKNPLKPPDQAAAGAVAPAAPAPAAPAAPKPKQVIRVVPRDNAPSA